MWRSFWHVAYLRYSISYIFWNCHWTGELRRAMLYINAAYAVAAARCPSVCPSATFLYSVETNKHIFDIFQPHHSSFFYTKHYGNIPMKPPSLTGTSNASRVDRQKSRRLSTNIWLSDRSQLSVINNWRLTVQQFIAVTMDVRLQHRLPPLRISESCLSQPAAWSTTAKRRLENRI